MEFFMNESVKRPVAGQDHKSANLSGAVRKKPLTEMQPAFIITACSVNWPRCRIGEKVSPINNT